MDMAKELAMTSNTKKGKETRLHYIAVEKAYNENADAIASAMIHEACKELNEWSRFMDHLDARPEGVGVREWAEGYK